MSSDEEASDVLSANSSAVSSLPAGARQAEAHDRAKRGRELHLYPTAPQVEKEKSFVWRCPLLYKPFKKSDARGAVIAWGAASGRRGTPRRLAIGDTCTL